MTSIPTTFVVDDRGVVRAAVVRRSLPVAEPSDPKEKPGTGGEASIEREVMRVVDGAGGDAGP